MTFGDMRRVLVIGPPGAGKSTLARVLTKKLGLPVVHLDQILWQPGWVLRDRDAIGALLAAATAEPQWIMDGNSVRTLPQRLKSADTVIWLDFNRWICLARVIWRISWSYGRTRADMTPGCPERFDLEFMRYIWSFQKIERPLVVSAIETDGRHCHLVRLPSPSEANRFLSSLK